MMAQLLRAEFRKLFSLRGTWVVLPLAVLLGLAASVAMCLQALIAAKVLHDDAALDWEPEQVVHWLRIITVTLLSLWAVNAVASERRAATMPLSLRAAGGPGRLLLVKWMVTGGVSALLVAVTVPLTVVLDAALVPAVTEGWSPLDSAVLHFQWTLPLYAVLACGIGVGLGACARSAALGVGGLLFWQFILEPFSLLAPKGAVLYSLAPFNNGAIFIGEESQFPLPFGGAAASALWFAVWAAAVLLLGWRAINRRRQ